MSDPGVPPWSTRSAVQLPRRSGVRGPISRGRTRWCADPSTPTSSPTPPSRWPSAPARGPPSWPLPSRPVWRASERGAVGAGVPQHHRARRGRVGAGGRATRERPAGRRGVRGRAADGRRLLRAQHRQGDARRAPAHDDHRRQHRSRAGVPRRRRDPPEPPRRLGHPVRHAHPVPRRAGRGGRRPSPCSTSCTGPRAPGSTPTRLSPSAPATAWSPSRPVTRPRWRGGGRSSPSRRRRSGDIYARLGVLLTPDDSVGESFYNPDARRHGRRAGRGRDRRRERRRRGRLLRGGHRARRQPGAAHGPQERRRLRLRHHRPRHHPLPHPRPRGHAPALRHRLPPGPALPPDLRGRAAGGVAHRRRRRRARRVRHRARPGRAPVQDPRRRHRAAHGPARRRRGPRPRRGRREGLRPSTPGRSTASPSRPASAR